MVDGVEHGQFIVQKLCLVLRIIAQLNIVTNFQHSTVRNLLHDALHQRRFSFAILTHESHFFSTLDGEVHLVEHHVLAIVFLHILANHGIISTSTARRKFEMKARSVNFVNLNGHNFLQLLDAALHLHRFGGFVAKTLYEIFQISNFFLLIFIGAELTFSAFGTQLHILIICHTIVYHFATRNFEGAVGHIVDESAVVAHQHHRTATVCQKLL